MPNRIPTPGEQHPEHWRRDLNPNANAGQNVGLARPHPELDARTAYDVKEAHDQLQGLTDDELRQIPILPSGSRLEQGATYLDLKHPERGEFTARGDMEAEPGAWCVPKSQVDYQLWNRLIGVENPERLGTGSETE
jgi:hypothetical protein